MPTTVFMPAAAQLWFPLAVVVFLESLAVHTWKYREEPGGRWLSYLIGIKGLWLFSVMLALRNQDPSSSILWQQIGAAVSLLAAYSWYRFIAEISRFERRAPSWLHRAMLVSILLCWLMIGSNGWTGWIFRAFWMEAGTLHVQMGQGGLEIAAIAFVFNGLSAVVNIRWASHLVGLRRRQAWLFLAPSLWGWTGQYLTFRLMPETATPYGVSFLVSGLTAILAFHLWRRYSIVPMAREAAAHSMPDGLLVLDDSGCLVDMNAVAASIFGTLRVEDRCETEQVYALWSELETFDAADAPLLQEMPHVVDGEERYYQVRHNRLLTPSGYLLGRLFIFRDLTHEKRQQEHILAQQKALTMMEERERLGRELHDGPGQLWGFLGMQTQAARVLIARRKYELADEKLQQLLESIQNMHVGLRESITGLQASVHPELGLPGAIEDQLRWYKEHCDLRTELRVDGEWQAGLLAPNAEAQALRILQEALANVRKSANASQVTVYVGRGDGHVSFAVEDDGVGFDPAQVAQLTGHHGLRIMEERAREIGAQLKVDSTPGHGARVELRIPCLSETAVESTTGGER